jgi:hypothetical protein
MPHLQEALGPGYEVIFKSLAAESAPGPAGGTIESLHKRRGRRGKKSRKSRSLSGGRHRRHSPKFDYNPRSGKLHYHWSRGSRSRSRKSSSRLRGGAAESPSISNLDLHVSQQQEVVSSAQPAGGQVSAGARSRWTEFVKAYSRKHKISYKEALSKAAPSWRSAKRRAKGLSPHR